MKQGVSPEDASYFVGRSYLSIVQDAERNCRDPNRFDALIDEQTPGGLNEQVRCSFSSLVHFDFSIHKLRASNSFSYPTFVQSLRNLEAQGVFEAYDRTMDAVLSRLQGKSDGSLPPHRKK